MQAEDIEIDWEMKEGYNPYRVKKMDNVIETGQILLLHGYCVQRNGFILDYFDNHLLYQNYNQGTRIDITNVTVPNSTSISVSIT